jgi:hypothetical protein
MKVAVMQPYFFPYIGYFQLINAVDLFIVYDNIKYTKKGWISRNRMLQQGKAVAFSLALKRGSDFLDVRDRELAADFDRGRLLNQIREAYRRAPYFAQAFPVVEQVLQYGDRNLFRFLHNSILKTCEYLGIGTAIAKSSDIQIDQSLKHQDKVIALCERVGAGLYVNAIGGTELYSREDFQSRGIELKFIKPKPFEYRQFDNEFVPWLSIIDVMMFSPAATIGECLASNYELI